MNIETDLKIIMKQCEGLNAEEKAKLVKHLLADSSISVYFGNSQFHANTYQINLATSEQMAGILEAIANKIYSNEK